MNTRSTTSRRCRVLKNNDAVARAKMTDKSARILKNDDVVTDAVTLENHGRNLDAVPHENILAREKPRGQAQNAEKRETATESPYAGTDRREYK